MPMMLDRAGYLGASEFRQFQTEETVKAYVDHFNETPLSAERNIEAPNEGFSSAEAKQESQDAVINRMKGEASAVDEHTEYFEIGRGDQTVEDGKVHLHGADGTTYVFDSIDLNKSTVMDNGNMRIAVDKGTNVTIIPAGGTEKSGYTLDAGATKPQFEARQQSAMTQSADLSVGRK